MSNFIPGAKFKVSGLFKAAYRWLRDESEPAQSASPPPSPAPAGPPPPTAKPPAGSPKAGSPAAAPAAHASNGESLHLPLQPVLDTLPAELKSKLQERSVGQMTIPVPVAKIVAQLPLGVVKITFGELRQAAPHVFAPTADADNALVSLPLSEILPRLGAAKLSRRADQKVVEVPDEVTSPFGARGKGLVISAAPEKSSSTTHQAATQPPNPIMPGNVVPPTATPPAFQRGMTPAAPALPARAVAPAAPAYPPLPTSPPKPVFPPAASVAAPTSPPSIAHPLVQPAANGGNGSNGSNGKGTPLPSFAPRPTSPPAAAPAAAGANLVSANNPPPASTETLEVPLLSLMNAWPQAVRLEIAQMNLMDAKVVFPVAVLEKGLRQGKVEFPWKLVRAWIRPELPPQTSPSDGVALDLPLSVVAPLFIARRKPAAKAQRKVAVDETIPNLFFGFPQAEGAPGFGNAAPVSAPVAAKSADTNFYALRDYEEEKAQAEKQAAATPPTDFLKRGATPNELVTRATSLPGVAGAVVALPDGLAVASRVPATYNSDTLAAFLPQIFGKVSQCTAELRMGSLNNLNFTVGNVPWKIFRVNNVFFAAFGRAEEPLPSSQLAALAAELDRKPKAT